MRHASLGTFNDRVNYAARVISAGAKNTTRNFDNCFEMHDGDAVVSALFRRAQKNSKLAAMLPHVLVAEDCKDYFPGQDLNAVSLRLQAEADAKFKQWLAESNPALAPKPAREIQTDLFNNLKN